MKLQLVIEDLDALRQHLKLDRLFLIGHSWGGMLAMAYADKYPGHVDELILISSGGPTNEYENWFGDNIESRMRPEDVAMRKYWMESVKRGVEADKAFLEALRPVVPAYFFDRSKGLAFAAQLQDGDVHADTFNLISADRRKDYSLGPGLRKLDRPVLIIQGHQDPIGQKTAEDIHALIKSPRCATSVVADTSRGSNSLRTSAGSWPTSSRRRPARTRPRWRSITQPVLSARSLQPVTNINKKFIVIKRANIRVKSR
jgi:pimeloyl-ACP methyl ester carboxylesterase